MPRSGTNSQGNHYSTPGGSNSNSGSSYHCKSNEWHIPNWQTTVPSFYLCLCSCFHFLLFHSHFPDSNSNGSYYYSNDNGSTYYNSGSGSSTYTSPSGNSTSKWGMSLKQFVDARHDAAHCTTSRLHSAYNLRVLDVRSIWESHAHALVTIIIL
jgi:hypothetical protein